MYKLAVALLLLFLEEWVAVRCILPSLEPTEADKCQKSFQIIYSLTNIKYLQNACGRSNRRPHETK